MDYNFLELVQMVARESGTIAEDLPQTVVGQTGRVGKIVRWVDLAWDKIQSHHVSWRWMHGEFTSEIEPGMYRYSSIQMGITRFARWVSLPYTLSIYDNSIGLSDEGFLYHIDSRSFKRRYEIGQQEPARPACFSIDPANLLMFGPTPDKVYVVRGEYYRSPQILVNDGDIPECPQRFRPVIGWYALVLLSQHDEGGFAVATARQNYNEMLSLLEMDQLENVQVFRRLL
jgi:hypothetical protein